MTIDHICKQNIQPVSRRASLAKARTCVGALTLLLVGFAAQAANFQLVNIDEPGLGFNDPTPAAPIGGNPGTTIGQQRQFVFLTVADLWGNKLKSEVPIKVLASFAPLPCTSAGGTLGGAGPTAAFFNFPNAPRAGTWYPSALANKLTGVPINPNPDPFESADIMAMFNSNIGKPGCLDGAVTYLGVDGKAPPGQIVLANTVLHEFGHGLGFITFTSGQTGQQLTSNGGDPAGLPSVWDHLLFDPKLRKTWDLMSNQERGESALVPRNLVWKGDAVTRHAKQVLARGTPELFVTGAGLNKFFIISEAEFGPRVDARGFLSTQLGVVEDQSDGLGLACTPLDAKNSAAVSGRVAIVDRGGCAASVKVKNAQLAGARAVLIANNTAGTLPPPLRGADQSIAIPALSVSQEDGKAIKQVIGTASARDPLKLGPFAVLFVNPGKLNGADYFDRVYMFTPNLYSRGSSVSHYDQLARPNLLMEPEANPNQPFDVTAPNDLTLELFRDLGW